MSLEDELREYCVQLDAAIERRVEAHNRLTSLPIRQPDRISRRWMQRGIAATLLVGAVAVVLIVVETRRAGETPVPAIDGSADTETSPSSSAESSVAPDTAVVSSTSVEAPTTVTQFAAPTELGASLDIGDSGDDVARLQTRLAELHFAPGPVDGVFGSATAQAVWAYKKLIVGIAPAVLAELSNPAGVTPDLWLQMQQPLDVTPRRALGAGTAHIEIYLPEQVLVAFVDDEPVLIAHISSGSGQSFCETVTFDTSADGSALAAPVESSVCGVARTPGGVFRIRLRLAGKRVSPLGGMRDPLYFNFGIAIHGSKIVPLTPVSHGMVRTDDEASAILNRVVDVRDVVYVWGGDGREPQDYSKAESLPTFSYPDPDATTTTVERQVEVPLLTGLLVDQATEKLAAVGLTTAITYQDLPYGSVNDRRVISQSIPVGQSVAAGTAVDLVIGRTLAAATTTTPE